MPCHTAHAAVTKPAVEDKAAYWSRDASGVLAELSSSIQGLSSAEAARRLKTEGTNAIDEEPAMGVARLALG
ncbi:MAG: cation-transporting P-type ATPase, partial [Nitrospira sp.]